ncbi:hypothetical protein D7316_03602 [Gordonia insulae]|uniref:Uncharacterized protein n=1 Tax=Gordonia insulae TaxID=2420509 RepID=A0A3G8JPI1_9ACTN|nr:hypothetical protein D7316_03602 [Gordonia insulae]
MRPRIATAFEEQFLGFKQFPPANSQVRTADRARKARSAECFSVRSDGQLVGARSGDADDPVIAVAPSTASAGTATVVEPVSMISMM